MIKMRVNNDKNSKCDECGRTWNNTKEMIDINIFNEIHCICFECNQILFQKTLRVECNYNSRVKSKEDQIRARRVESLKDTKPHISINEAMKGLEEDDD